MILQSVGTIETLLAFVTSVAAFAAMNQTMLVVNGSSQESFSADCAAVTKQTRQELS